MNFEEILNLFIQDTADTSVGLIRPELILCGTILSLLFVRLFSIDRWITPSWVALVGAFVAFGFAANDFMVLKEAGGDTVQEIFTGLLIFDRFTAFFRIFLLLFLVLVVTLTILSGLPDLEDGPDFYTLLFGSTIGMMVMASSNHLLILFLGVEMTSVPSYVMVGFLKGKRVSSEASFKYVVYGAGASGVMLYGISLLAGLLGTGNMSLIAERLQMISSSGEPIVSGTAISVMILMVMVGLAFKLSVFPFHFWCPDAFEGASAEVAGFLSVASKAGAFALLVRFALAFSAGDAGALQPTFLYIGLGVGVIAAITATYGNLAAYMQTNVKRLLAYSTIAHAGYMLMGVASVIVLMNAPGEDTAAATANATQALEGLLYYLAVYLFMNLGAFAVVAFIRNSIFSEEIEDYAGLISVTPILCVCMLICMFSLIGMPPFGGFVGKFMIFASLFEAGNIHWVMWLILVAGGLNTVFSLFYYLKVLKVMFLDPRPAGAPDVDVRWGSLPGFYTMLVTAPVVVLGVLVQGLSSTAQNVASVLFP
ncbi:MAG: NADH-quinone oxidoreductase subunit N [Planctomycetaceae bacterium]|nr:NADH-quinone oxidoreductase subunit N [Planctomycetaceae bacterium]